MGRDFLQASICGYDRRVTIAEHPAVIFHCSTDNAPETPGRCAEDSRGRVVDHDCPVRVACSEGGSPQGDLPAVP